MATNDETKVGRSRVPVLCGVARISARGAPGRHKVEDECGSPVRVSRLDALRVAVDLRTMIEGWGALVAEVSPLVSPLLLVLRSAAETDDEAANLYAELDQARLDRMADNAQHLAKRQLRANVTAAQARDVLWLCSSPELYELLVQQRGWTPQQLGGFVTDTITGNFV